MEKQKKKSQNLRFKIKSIIPLIFPIDVGEGKTINSLIKDKRLVIADLKRRFGEKKIKTLFNEEIIMNLEIVLNKPFPSILKAGKIIINLLEGAAYKSKNQVKSLNMKIKDADIVPFNSKPFIGISIRKILSEKEQIEDEESQLREFPYKYRIELEKKGFHRNN